MKRRKKYVFFLLFVVSTLLIATGFVVGNGNGVTLRQQNIDTITGNAPVNYNGDEALPLDTTTTYVSEIDETVQDESVQMKTNGYETLRRTLNSASHNRISLKNVLRGILGIIVIMGMAWLFSNNRKAIRWKYVLSALLFQIVLAVCIIYVPAFSTFFNFIGKMFLVVTASAEDGIVFLFGNLINFEPIGYMFAFKILPSIIFFSTISSMLFYWGIIQIVVKGLGWFFSKIMGLSGVESLSLAGNIFMGQTEAPLIVKQYLPNVTDAEMFMVMVGGMATMSGGVLSAYIALLGGGDPQASIFFARHLLAASVMAAPASVVIGRILVPQPFKEVQDVVVEKVDKSKTNILDVITNGAIEGTKLAGNVAAMLLVFVALISFCNIILFKIGDVTSLNEIIAANTNYDALSLQCVLGYALSPLMWIIGVPSSDIFYLGQLLGEKTIINEFVGYATLNDMITNGLLQPKSIIMGVYLMCGFANFGSIGIQIGGIGSLAPTKRHVLSQFGVRALIVAASTALLSSVIMGAILG